jgi:hypothetical protein
MYQIIYSYYNRNKTQKINFCQFYDYLSDAVRELNKVYNEVPFENWYYGAVIDISTDEIVVELNYRTDRENLNQLREFSA